MGYLHSRPSLDDDQPAREKHTVTRAAAKKAVERKRLEGAKLAEGLAQAHGFRIAKAPKQLNALQASADAEARGAKGRKFKAPTVVRKAGAREQQFDYTCVLAALAPNRALHFADDGQDFLRWYLAPNGVVVCSEPFQTDQWAGFVVVEARVGEYPIVLTRDGTRTFVLHRVKRVTKLKQAKR